MINDADHFGTFLIRQKQTKLEHLQFKNVHAINEATTNNFRNGLEKTDL